MTFAHCVGFFRRCGYPWPHALLAAWQFLHGRRVVSFTFPPGRKPPHVSKQP